MKFVTLSFRDDSRSSAVFEIEANHGWWVRFGDDVLTYAADAKFNTLMDNLPGKIDADTIGNVKKGDMHLVVQKGRIFQIKNPGVRVILDKGRYLVVDLPKAAARKLSKKGQGFHIEPLAENTTVFESRDRVATERELDPQIADIVNSVQPSFFESNLMQLVSYPSRFATSAGFMDAADWALNELTALGLDCEVVPINVPGFGTSANVVARKTGSAPAGHQNIIVVAHLDSFNQVGGQNAPAPGADDNASGSAGLLTIARALAEIEFRNDLTFVLFGGEEQGLHGSKQFVAGLSTPEKADIRSVLNMDMIGSLNGTPASVLLEGAPVSQWMIDALASAAASYSSLDVQISLNPFASDHVPFLDADIPAVLTIEGADGANDAIHTGDDTPDRIDIGFAMEILRMNIGFIASEAGLVLQPSGACSCPDVAPDAATAQQLRVLSGHFHGLLAQYSRLARDGRIEKHDHDNWRLVRATHDAVSAYADPPQSANR